MDKMTLLLELLARYFLFIFLGALPVLGLYAFSFEQYLSCVLTTILNHIMVCFIV